MANQKKTAGCGTLIFVWVIVAVVLGAFFSAINKTGQSIGNIVLASVVLGSFFAFFIWLFWNVIRTKKNMRNRNRINPASGNGTFVPKPPIVPSAKVVNQKVPQETPMTDNIQTPDTKNRYKFQAKAVDGNYEFDKKVPKCNCDGCPKQDACEYGHVVYDDITKERMSLFDKFMMLHTFDCCVSPEDFGNVATNKELHDKRLLLKLDKNVLYNTLNYLQEVKKVYLAFGKCGRAYFNFMKMGDEISLVKGAVREYDEYQAILKQQNLVKLYVLDRINKEGEFKQEKIYENFPDIERKNVTSAVKEMEKAGDIIREKCEKTYIIRKNNA